MMASRYGFDGTPNIVMIGVPNEAALRRACVKMTASQIPHWEWTEPDFDLGFTSICTAPITGEQRACLANYRLWKPVYSPVVQPGHAPSKSVDAGEIPAGRAKLRPYPSGSGETCQIA